MTMRAIKSDYMHWAKFKPSAHYSLTTSEVPHFRMDRLPFGIDDLDLDGASHPRYLPLRERIAARYAVKVDEIVTADGTSMANFLAIASLISPGDEILIEHPAYELLIGAATFLGARVRRFERKASDGFRLDPQAIDQAMTPETRLIIVTNLHNPSSALASNADLEAIGSIAAANGAHVLVDEVYLDAVNPALPSAKHLGPSFIATNSLTKAYGLSGLRCGWILAQPEIAERMWRLNDLFGVNQAHQAERLACIAFDHIDEVVAGIGPMLARNRHAFNEFISIRTDLECEPAKHGLTAFPRWLGGDTQRLDDHLHQHYDAAIVPGRWFEMPDHFRVGFGLREKDFEQALSRLSAGLDDLA